MTTVEDPSRPLGTWRRMRAEGMTLEQIGAQYGIKGETVGRWLRGMVTRTPRPRRERSAPWDIDDWREEQAVLEAARELPRCQSCGIILERSDVGQHPADSLDAGYCWMCRRDYPELCQEGAFG